MYINDYVWKELQKHLPTENQINSEYFPIESFLRIGDYKIHIDNYIPKKDKNICVIIFHGVGGNGRLLSFIAIPLLKAGYEVICPDLPGYGYSEYNKYPTYNEWIMLGSEIVRIKANENKKIILIGLSAGGMLAYNVASVNDMVNGLIVTNILDNRIEIVRKYSAKNAFQAKYGIKILEKMPKFIKNMKVPISMVTNIEGLVNSKKILSILLRDKRGAGNKVQINFLLSMMNSLPRLEPEAFNKVPVFLCHPGNDKWTPMNISELFFDKIASRKSKITLENCGHFPIESPGKELMQEEIIKFINLTTAST